MQIPSLSLIVAIYDNLSNKINEVNGRLMNMCKERNIPYVDHADTILPERHLNKSNLHFVRYGILAFANNFPNYLLKLNCWPSDDSSNFESEYGKYLKLRYQSYQLINLTLTKYRIHQKLS